MSTFSDRLRQTRAQRGWTQKELAEISGLTPSAIGNYESGQRLHPSAAALLRLSEVLGVTPAWLSQGTASPASPTPSATGEWPFRDIPYERFLVLNPQQRHQLEMLVRAYVDSCSR